MNWLSPEILIALATLTFLEIVLGVDNIIFISILSGRLPPAREPISAFVHRHPTVRVLGLSFLLLIGMSLLLEGFDHHIPKGYVYFAMEFSVFVEMINLRVRRKTAPVHLREAYVPEAETPGPSKAS